jgi:apolipoprotein N-acyltransferase
VWFTAIQPKLEKRTPWSTTQRDHALDLLRDTIRTAPPDSIVVTPETFLPEPPPATPEGRWAELLDQVEQQRVHLLLGVPHHARDGNVLHLMNTVMHLAPGRQALYAKERSVPGGEYLPWPRLLGSLYRHVFTQVTQGQTPAPPELTAALFAANTELGMSICHEQSFALTMAERAQRAAVLVNVSDDSWIDSDAYRAQMLGTARLRAMELGKPLLRVSHGARSVLIDPRGRVEAGAAGLEPQVLSLKVTPRDGNTPYQRAASAIAAAPIVTWFGVMFLACRSGVPPARGALRGRAT